MGFAWQLAMIYTMVFLMVTMFLGVACLAIGGVQVLVALRSRRTKRQPSRHTRGKLPSSGTEYQAASHPRTSQWGT